MPFGDDDMARNVWNEMQRDAAPSPEEARKEQRRWLAAQGCEHDGCDEDDPDKLQPLMPYVPSCRHIQPPPSDGPENVYCDEHKPDSARQRYLSRMADRARDQDACALAVYECGALESVDRPEMPTRTVKEQVAWDDEEPVYREKEIDDPRRQERPTASIECRCGSPLDEVRRLDE